MRSSTREGALCCCGTSRSFGAALHERQEALAHWCARGVSGWYSLRSSASGDLNPKLNLEILDCSLGADKTKGALSAALALCPERAVSPSALSFHDLHPECGAQVIAM